MDAEQAHKIWQKAQDLDGRIRAVEIPTDMKLYYVGIFLTELDQIRRTLESA